MIVTKQTLPKGWRWIKLEELAKLQSGGTPSRGNLKYYGGIIPWAKILDLTKAGKWISSTEEYITEAALQESSAQVFPEMTVLFAMYGSIGTCSIAQKPISTNQAILGCICGDSLYPEYLYYWFFLNKEVFLKMGRGGTQANLNAGIVKSLEIPLPPFGEQKRIATRLSEQMSYFEKAREAAEESLSAAWELPSAYLLDIFEHLSNSEFPKRKLGDFILSYRNGFGRRPKELQKDGVIVLRLADISGGIINLDTPRRVDMSTKELEAYQVTKGDLLFVRVNGSKELVGRCAVFEDVGEPIAYNDHIIRVKLNDEIFPDYAKLITETKKVRDIIVEKASTSAGQLTINQETIGSIEIPLIPIDEQKKLVEDFYVKLKTASQLQQSLETQLAEINELPSALLRQAFAGGT